MYKPVNCRIKQKVKSVRVVIFVCRKIFNGNEGAAPHKTEQTIILTLIWHHGLTNGNQRKKASYFLFLINLIIISGLDSSDSKTLLWVSIRPHLVLEVRCWLIYSLTFCGGRS